MITLTRCPMSDEAVQRAGDDPVHSRSFSFPGVGSVNHADVSYDFKQSLLLNFRDPDA